MKSIERHTAELKRGRLAQKRERLQGRDFSSFGRDLVHRKARFGGEPSNLTSLLSEMDNFINMAKMPGAGYNSGAFTSGWRVTAKAPEKPYQPILKDTYPRNEFTMMPVHNAPKYYTGHFMKYDYKDIPLQPSGDFNEGRPVVFKKQDIETVQTKKKYGDNPKGQSSVPLHLCNDTNSLLYRRSLQPSTLDKLYLPTPSSALSYPFALHKRVKNEESALHPLKYNDPTQTWVNTKYPTDDTSRGRRSRVSSPSTVFGPSDRSIYLENADIPSGRVRTAPEWFSEFYPRQKVADTMKFMGSPKQSIQSKRSKEYDVNFNGIK